MAYVRKKKLRKGDKEYVYHQLVRGYREDGKVKQEVVAHLGHFETPEAALEAWQSRANHSRQHARELRRGAQLIRERRVWGRDIRYGSFSWCLPREGTEVPEKPVYFSGFAPPGWFYARGSVDDIERQAREADAEAEEFERKVERLRAAS